MIKSILILLSFSSLLFSAQQIVLVVADNFTTTKAHLEFYEGGELLLQTNVNIGHNGLAWGDGIIKFPHEIEDPIKREGDKKAPAGVFELGEVFGYAPRSQSTLPYLFSSKELICVDDSNSRFYNQIIIRKGNEKSFEYMRRDDSQYEIGVVVGHNKEAKKSGGSCIFLHVQKGDGIPTAGCTSMKLEDLRQIVALLKKEKNPILVQIPYSSRQEVLKHYPELKNSNLLHPHHQKSLSQ